VILCFCGGILSLSSKALIIPAAGAGKRMQRKQPKPFIKLDGQPILAHTVSRFLTLEGLEQIVVATSADYLNEARNILGEVVNDSIRWKCIKGGEERQQSVHKALENISDVDLVLVHDAVRPLITREQIKRCCGEAQKTGAAIPGTPSIDTIKRINSEHMTQKTLDRQMLRQVQTPQVFRAALLKKAYARAAEQHYIGTDDASLVERLGEPVKIVRGSRYNIKITYPQDLELAAFLLNKEEA
jgi:2-C-methyl-D-erythritol 4-phosphate cytidylyltransferase